MQLTLKTLVLAAGLTLLSGTVPVAAAKTDSNTPHPLAGMPLRNIGPAMISGRISDFAFHPERKHEFYVENQWYLV